MGQCMSSDPDSKENNDINKTIQKDKSKDKYVKKLLFLGSGGSGKSTLFKQLRTLHGTGYADKDRLQFKDHIFAQIVEQMRLCLECIDILKEDEPDEYKDVELSDSGKQAADILQSAPTLQVNAQISEAIEILWKEDAIRLIYDLRATMKIDDSCAYFWDEVQRIAAPDYVPDDKDILLVRYRTTGVIEQKFEIKKNLFHVFDVGGQKSERKKWIHCFELVTAVIFVASLSCYDEVMFEDDSVNCMIDSLDLFKEICNLQWFVTTPIILFLNKKDLFEKKIHIIALSVCFSDFTQQPPNSAGSNNNNLQNGAIMNGSKDNLINSSSEQEEDHMDQTQHINTENTNLLYDDVKNKYMIDARNFIKKKFVAFNENSKTRQIYVHITCATDKNNVQNVFNDVQQIVVSAGLERNNLI
mmetsp:Transcript_12752/g.11353  ORF Transcript_12752/g.11353 Transcript_12752/m.11353 type:complete len:414 (+) Transcript_12752:96-1337(+)